MYKLLLLSALVPLVICVALRVWFGKKPLKAAEAVQCSLSAEDLWEGMKKAVDLESDLKLGKELRPHKLNSKHASALGRVAYLAGREALSKRSKIVDLRQKMIRTAAMLPAFGVVLGVMGLLAMRFSPIISLSIVFAAAGFSCIMLLTSIHVELEAAKLGRKLMDMNNQIPRVSERDVIGKAALAAAWDTVLPIGFRWVF